MSEYYVPTQAELLDAIRAEFSFLVEQFGFRDVVQRDEKYINPYSVLYRKNQIAVLIEGISYGFSVDCQLRIEHHGAIEAPVQFSLGYLMAMRTPRLLEPRYPDRRGQLTQLPRLAEGLREAAMDLISGDFSRLNDARPFIAKEQEKAALEGRRRELSCVDSKSQEAFHSGDFRRVIDLLSPHDIELNKAARKRLEIARKRLRAD
jgi:hypothetical protein